MPGHRSLLDRPFDRMVVPVWGPNPLEEEIEAAMVRRLGSLPGRIMERQVECCGHKPDIVLLWGRTYTIVEVKRETVGHRALEQVVRYVDHWLAELDSAAEDYEVFGVLAAPRIRPGVRSSLYEAGIAFQPVSLVQRVA